MLLQFVWWGDTQQKKCNYFWQFSGQQRQTLAEHKVRVRFKRRSAKKKKKLNPVCLHSSENCKQISPVLQASKVVVTWHSEPANWIETQPYIPHSSALRAIKPLFLTLISLSNRVYFSNSFWHHQGFFPYWSYEFVSLLDIVQRNGKYWRYWLKSRYNMVSICYQVWKVSAVVKRLNSLFEKFQILSLNLATLIYAQWQIERKGSARRSGFPSHHAFLKQKFSDWQDQILILNKLWTHGRGGRGIAKFIDLSQPINLILTQNWSCDQCD